MDDTFFVSTIQCLALLDYDNLNGVAYILNDIINEKVFAEEVIG